MNTIGKILKNARINQSMSLSALENITKIKIDFIKKLENEDWDNLPEFPVVSGFVKNLSNALNLSVDNVNATLRRDYPPKKLRISPKPDIQNKFFWSPKFTFAICIVALTLFVLIYLGLQYNKFVKPPELYISNPIQNEIINQEKVKIEGKTTTDVVLTVNNQPISLDQDGNFSLELNIANTTKELIFIATSRSGKVTEKKISITVE